MSSEVNRFVVDMQGRGKECVLASDYDALHAEAEALRAALLGIASVNPAERGIEWAKSYASDGLKGAGSELYARWLDSFNEAEALRAENAHLQNALLEITARRFAESWKKRTSDADLEQYLAAGIAQLEAERDALRAELEAIKGQQPVAAIGAVISRKEKLFSIDVLAPEALHPGTKLYALPSALHDQDQPK